jgi:putative NADH-flavin reductase
MLIPGERTSRYRLGSDVLLVDPNGDSGMSIEDFAVALIDEAEKPQHKKARFTVAN